MIISIIIITIILCTTVTLITNMYFNYLKNINSMSNDIDIYSIQLNQDIMKSRELLNTLVKEALVEWSIYNVRREEESWMGEKRQEDCIEWVIERVYNLSTQAIIDQISIGYPADTMEKYLDSIKNITMLHVLEMSIKQNTIDRNNEPPNINLNL